MTRKTLYAAGIALVTAMALVGSAWAATDEAKLGRDATEIDKTASTSQGAKIVTQKIEKEFGVTDSQVSGLRSQNLGYGEISIVYSLAQKMPGGITDANVARIMTMRQGPPVMGWGKIAQELGTKLGPTVSRVRAMNRETKNEMKRERSSSSTGTGEQHREQHQEQHHEGMTHGGMGGGKGK